MNSLFGTSGIRGPVDTFFTPQFCFDIGRSFAHHLDNQNQQGTIALGTDSRQSSPLISEYLTAGLQSIGREVTDLGVVPAPAVNYVLVSGSFIASLMVTGSHIDITANGVKFFSHKEEIGKADEQNISEIYFTQKGTQPCHLPEQTPAQSHIGFENYIEFLLGLADKPLPRWKIVVDPGNGSQTEVIRTVLDQLDQEVIMINADLQNTLISRDTETEGAFSELEKAVLDNKADFGIGFDTDGDRLVFVDRFGKFVPGDYTGVLQAKWHTSKIIVSPVNSSSVLDSIGKEIVRTKVGSPFVVEAMKKYGSQFGFESNGGGINGDFMYTRDGGSSLLSILNILKWSAKPLDALLNEFPKTHILRGKFACAKENHAKILSSAAHFLTPHSIDRTDGVKLILDDNTWVLFRPSSNAPEFRVFVESNSATKAKQLITSAISFAKSL